MLLIAICFGSSCKSTRNLKEGQYLLRKNVLKVESNKAITRKGELNDALSSLVVQKPNSYSVGLFPYKLWLYNFRYKRYQKDKTAEEFQIKAKTVERPVLYDSALTRRSVQNMKGFLFNQGYFYASIKDTVKYNKKKATVVYTIQTGVSYVINAAELDVDDSTVKTMILESMSATFLTKGKPYNSSLLESERSRISDYLRNRGYYKFNQDNISFKLDTVNRDYFRNFENPFESAINFVTLQDKAKKQPSLNVYVVVRQGDQPEAYQTYGIGAVKIYPDFIDTSDINDPTMIQTRVDSVTFRYHKYYVREQVILNHIFLLKDDLYSQRNYDRTITRLNDLGIFQYVRVVFVEDTSKPFEKRLRCIIALNPVRKYDFTTNYEVTNATTYALGNSLTISARNKNLFRGANQLSLSVTGGIELGYDSKIKGNLFDKFYLFSKNIGFNANLELPKFLSPIAKKRFNRFNTPRTIFGLGFTQLDRVTLFRLTGFNSNFTYNWKQSQTKTWDLTPVFVNVLQLPYISPLFQTRLDSNNYLKKTYSNNFIEGEILSFTYANQNTRRLHLSYSYIKASVEEAGGLVAGIVGISKPAEGNFLNTYQQYVKLDIDARRYIPLFSSLLAGRAYAGVGLPYNKSTTLPYVKQYFSGGPYSVRGWRVRSLGPGSYKQVDTLKGANIVDLTGDIKLEANLEYRFDIVQLFGGAMKLNGAAFTDAGNIWLAQPSSDYPGGEFKFSKLGKDIAMSSGVGVRLDIGGLFVLRFDGAVPIKKPTSTKPGGFVLDELFSSKGWAGDNLILNVAIGYPF